MSGHRRAESPDGDDSDEWTSSSDGSKYSDSDSSVPEWDPDISEDGELVYIKYKEAGQANASPPKTSLLDNVDTFKLRNNFKRSSTRRASKGKIFKVLRSRQIKKVDKEKKIRELSTAPLNVEKKSQISCSEITIEVDRTKMFHSDKGCQLEQLFGISVNKGEDGKSLSVSNFLPEARILYESRVKKGYRLHTINAQEVNASNINAVLDKLRNDRQHYILTFTTTPQEAINIEFKNLLNSKTEHEFVLSQILRDSMVSVIFICRDVLDENSSADQGVLYCYPRPYTQNYLYNTRGAFVTLNHLAPKGLSVNPPLSSTILLNDVLINVIYVQRGEDLMLLAIPNNRITLFGAKMATDDIVRLLEFLFGSLRKCFSERANLYKIDNLFSRFFAMALCRFDSEDMKTTANMEEILCGNSSKASLFEQILPVAHLVTLPREARLQINDALAEMEAADYREWTDDPLNCQRLFVVIGCCLYYSGHLLSSHLQDDDLVDVHSFLRINGLLKLSRLGQLDKMVIWKEIFIRAHRKQSEPNSESNNEYRIPDGRWFLLVIGKGNFILASIMEAGGCTEELEGNPPPSPFYVEECESCLELLLEVGLDKFLASWFSSNCRPQVELRPELFTKQGRKMREAEASPKSDTVSKTGTFKPTELQSILKRKHHSSDQINVPGASGNQPAHYAGSQHNLYSQWYQGSHTQQKAYGMSNLDISYSEDTSSQQSNRQRRWLEQSTIIHSAPPGERPFPKGASGSKQIGERPFPRGRNSEINEERVAGRRADREQRNRRDSSGSDSEWEGQGGSRTSDSMDMSEMRKSLLDEINQITVHRVTAGEENVLLHFVQLEQARGVLLAPVKDLEAAAANVLYSYILNMFRAASQKIHALLQNTIRFKKILSPSSSINKSLVAIKEHGLLLQVPQRILSQCGLVRKIPEVYHFWVVGRLFNEPESKELYLCYHESVPQDMLEVAYRLSFLE